VKVAAVRSVSDDEIKIVVAQIRRITRTANLEFALRVGAVVLHHFFGGDTDAWRARGPKTASFRRLAEHPDLPISAGALCRCVAPYELCERLNAPTRWEHLGVSHLRVVLGLPPPVQERLLAAANENRWTVKDFCAAMRREETKRATRGGRQVQSPVTKTLRALRKCLLEHEPVPQDLEGLSARDIAESLHLVNSARRSLEQLSESLCVAQERAREGKAAGACYMSCPATRASLTG
jgi:hypothetical protein